MSRRLLTLAASLLLAGACADFGEQPLATAPEAPAREISTSIDLTGVLEFQELPDLTKSRRAEKYIRASEGGVVELNGFRVEIPAGALPADTLVTIDLPTDQLLASHVLAEFGPHGIQFNAPVTVSFPLQGVIMTGGALEVARWENGAWTSLGGVVSADGKRLSSTTPHFSTYSARDTHVMAGG